MAITTIYRIEHQATNTGPWQACNDLAESDDMAVREQRKAAYAFRDYLNEKLDMSQFPGYFDNMFQQYHDSFITFKKVNGTIVVKKDDGGYIVTETTTHEIHSEKEMLEYVYSLGLRHGAPSAH